jgi:hypothetical protein
MNKLINSGKNIIELLKYLFWDKLTHHREKISMYATSDNLVKWQPWQEWHWHWLE